MGEQAWRNQKIIFTKMSKMCEAILSILMLHISMSTHFSQLELAGILFIKKHLKNFCFGLSAQVLKFFNVLLELSDRPQSLTLLRFLISIHSNGFCISTE